MIIKIDIDDDCGKPYYTIGLAKSLVSMNGLNKNINSMTDDYAEITAEITHISKAGNIFIHVSKAERKAA